ncbi:MAG: GNAT family N-acetyltransferase [Planctomycetes bacterium]|nr:GNAT family N-acetyltransferase [Planctomycetota bacterium]
MEAVELRALAPRDLERIREVDRSEHVRLQYVCRDGALREEVVDWDVPRWPEHGPDDFSVRGLVERWTPLLSEGGTLLGAIAGDTIIGFAILRPDLSPGVAELVALYIDQGARRRGIAGALTDEVERLARLDGAELLYVSATPSESAVGFYLSRGFRIARRVHAELAAQEPEDIQMEKTLSNHFWDKRADRYDAKLHKGPNYAARLERAAAVFRKTDSILDVGCATGEITLDLAPHAEEILGIDHSSNMVTVANARARERNVGNARFEQMEPDDPRLAEGAFNVVTAYSVIHLLDDVPATLARLRDLLVPGGHLITETPCLGDWNFFWRALVRLAMLVGAAPPVVCLRVAELESMIENAGFEVLESKVHNPKSKQHCILARNR